MVPGQFGGRSSAKLKFGHELLRLTMTLLGFQREKEEGVTTGVRHEKYEAAVHRKLIVVRNNCVDCGEIRGCVECYEGQSGVSGCQGGRFGI